MDEIKSKFLSLLNKQGPKIPSMGFSDANYHFPKAETLSINSKTAPEADRPADQEILESIEAAYFAPSDFDICRFELEKLPDVLDCDRIQADFKLLKRQHQVVSKKVLQLILEHQNACGDEFKEMLTLCEELGETLSLCRDGRGRLHVAERQVAATLCVLANHRKRKYVQHLLNDLNTIKALYQTDNRLRDLLQQDNYAGAIRLILECQSAAQKHKHFACVAALTNKLQETLEYTEEQLDRVLAQTCYFFDATRYSRLQEAYKLLGKTQIAVDHLHMHYISSIYNTSVNIVYVYIQQDALNVAGDTPQMNDSKKPYKNLCLAVNQENFIPCLMDLCKALFKIVLSYRNLVRWHEANDVTDESVSGDEEGEFNKLYIKQKLEHNLTKIWQDVQSKVSSLLMNSDLGMYKFDQFVQVLGVVHRLIEVGEEFASSKSEELHESIRVQSVNYFKHYHAQRLEELKIFLENEAWRICPVKHTFDILQLQEFKAMKHVLKTFRRTGGYNLSLASTATTAVGGGDAASHSSTHSQDGSTFTGNYFIRYAEHGTPFDFAPEEAVDEDILLSDGDYCTEESDDEDEELQKDYVDEYAEQDRKKEITHKENQRKERQRTHVLTNTTLTVLRQMGKYLQMSRLLKPIAFDVIRCMNQLFDFYLYAVHCFFASDLTVSSSTFYSLSLSSTLKRIRESLIYDHCEDIDGLNGEPKVYKPLLSSMVDLKKPEMLHGLAERIVGVESLIFLARQYEALQGYLESLVPPQNKSILQQFFNQTISSAIDLRRPVYMTVCAQAFDLRQILASMAKINWEVKEVMSQHNAYVDLLLREIQIFTMRLEQVNAQVHISAPIMSALWENIAHIITHTLVQGFAEARKCTPCGRALMRLDFTHFLQTFEQITGVRPMAHKDYVDAYINAFYIPELELDAWMRAHAEYSTKHLYSLVSCACGNNKKSKQRLFAVIEELERAQR